MQEHPGSGPTIKTSERDDIQAPRDGTGPLNHRKYRVRIINSQLAAQELLQEFRRDPNRFSLTSYATFVPDPAPQGLREEETFEVKLPGPWETVTWRAKHFGITWKMTSKITELEAPHRFVDEQLKGPFKLFRHEHLFHSHLRGTKMVDLITFDAPFGPIGGVAEKLLLGSHLSKLIAERNDYLRACF